MEQSTFYFPSSVQSSDSYLQFEDENFGLTRWDSTQNLCETNAKRRKGWQKGKVVFSSILRFRHHFWRNFLSELLTWLFIFRILETFYVNRRVTFWLVPVFFLITFLCAIRHVHDHRIFLTKFNLSMYFSCMRMSNKIVSSNILILQNHQCPTLYISCHMANSDASYIQEATRNPDSLPLY